MAINNRYITVTITDDDKDEFDEEKIRRNDALQYQKYVEASKRYNLAQNSLSERAASELIKNETAKKNSLSNDMSYEEQKNFVKENRDVLKSNYRAARNDYVGKAIKGALTFWDSSDDITDEEKEKFKAVKSQYKSDKKAYNQTLDDIKFAEKNEREAMAYNAMKDSDTVKLLADMDAYYQQQADDAKQAAKQARQMLEATGNSNNGSAWQSYQGRSHDIAKGNQYTGNSAKYDNAVNALKEKGYSDKDIQDLYDYYKKDKDKKYTKEVTDIFDAMQDEGGLAGKVMANVASVSSKLSSDNKVAVAEDILYGLDARVNDRYIDANTNSQYHLGQNVSDEIRIKTSEDIQRNSDNSWIANFIYQTGMSMADFGATLPAASMIGQAGANKVMQEAASLGVLSTSAAVSKTKEATDNGLNADQAASLGIIAGAAEIITEHASIDALFNSSSTGIKYILQNALTEGSEEVGSDIINEIADLIISGDKADIKAQYQNYLNEGYSDKDAFINVLVSKAQEYGTDFLGGALSGGIMSGGATAINKVTQNNQYRSVGNELKQNGNAQAEINAGLAQDNTSKAYQAAQVLQNSLEQNAYNNDTEEFDYSQLNSRKLGRLAEYNAQNQSEISNVDTAIDKNNKIIQPEKFYKKIINSFNIEKLGDYIHVQKQVFSTLKNENFFKDNGGNSRTEINLDSGMEVEINKSGINETFNFDNYIKTSKELKTTKLATVRYIPEIIKNGKLIADNQSNSHNQASKIKYAYIQGDIEVNGNPVTVKLSIRKSPQKNKFWVHHVYIKNNTESNSAVVSKNYKTDRTTFGATDNVPQNDTTVNSIGDTEENIKLLEKSAEVFEGDTAKSYVYAYSDNGYEGNVYDYNKGFSAVYKAQQQGKSFKEAYGIALDEGSHITPIQAEIAYEAARNDMGNNIKYSLNPDFVKQYDSWDKVNPRTVFNIGTTSAALQTLGLQEKEILWDSSKIVKIKNSHPEMSDEIIKQVPNIIEEPIVAMKSKTKSSRLTMFGEVYSAENKPILAVVELNPNDRNGLELNAFKLASAYGKDNAQKFLNSSDIVYTDGNKKRVSRWEKRTGLQLPVGSSVANSNTNITQNINGVNNHSMPKDKVDTKAKVEFERILYSKPKSGATILSKDMTDLQKAETVLIDKFAKNIGKEVIIVDDTEKLGYDASNGMYINDKIVLATNADGGMMSVYFGHELFHSLKMSSKEQAQALEDFIIKYLKGKADYDYNARVEKIIQTNKFKGTREQQIAAANEEIAANACFTVFAEQANFESLVKQDRSLAQKVRDFFADFIERIEKAIEYIRGYEEYKTLENENEVKQKILDMFNDCLKESQKNNTAVNSSESKYSIKYPQYTDEQLKNNAHSVINMDSVISLNGNEFDGNSSLSNKIDEYFSSLDNNIYSKEYGDISLSKTSRRSEIRHGSTRLKNVSYKAIPNVIKSGKTIYTYNKEKVERVVVAAPINIADERYYMGVMLQRDNQNQRLYLHDIITEKETALSTEDNLNTTRSSGDENNLFMTNILQKALSVNSNDMQDKAKYSLKEDNLQKEIDDVQKQIVSLRTKITDLKNSDEYNRMVSNISTSYGVALDIALSEYGKWLNDSGLNDAIRNLDELQKKEKKMRQKISNEDSNINISKDVSDLSADEINAYINKAEKHFGTTTDYSLAGYLTVNGKMLDFSDGQKTRVQDHREINNVLDFLGDDANFSDGLILFMNMGNIRLNRYGIDIAKAPNDNQISVLKKMFDKLNGEVTVDFSNKNGDNVANIDYIKGTSPEKIINDINYFYKNEVLPEQSVVSQFHTKYSFKESINVDEFDESGYDIINTTGKKGYTHFKSEVMTWDSDRYLDKIRFTRIDDKFYIYKMVGNDSRDIWIYKPKSQLSKNQLKEMREYYATRNHKGSVDVAEIVRNKRRYSNGNNELFGRQREKSRNNDKFNSQSVRGEGDDNRRGTAQNDSDDYLQEERYSIKETPVDFNAVLEENAELSEMNEDLQQMLKFTSAQNEKLKNEFKITDRHNLSSNAVDKTATALRKQYESSYDKQSLVSNLAGLYDYIANAGKDIDSGYLWTKATDIAKNIIANSQYKDTTVYDEYKELRHRIRNTDIRVPQAVQDNFADYNAFRRENFGRLRLTKEGVELDAFYNELSAQYPEFFNAEITDASEQLEALANFFEVTAPVYYNSAEQNAESMGLNMEQYANLVAGDIIDKYFDVPEVMTAAEKHKKEMDSLKLHYRNQISDMRQSYKNRYDERLREVKAENAKRVTKLRADKADALAKQKAHFEDVSRRGKDRRKASDVKRKIRNIKKQLDSKLLNPTETSYVPQYLVKEIASVCDMITEADKYWKNGNSKAESTVLKLDALHRQYENLAKDGNYDFATEFDSNIAENISTLADALNGKQISELSLAELEDVYNVLKDIKNSLVDATKQIGREEKISNYEARERIVNETMATKGMNNTVIGKYEYWTMNSMRFIRKITEYKEDAELYKQFLEIEKGQRKADKVFMELSKPFVELRNEGKIEFRKSKKTREIVNDWTKFISDKIETPFIDIQGKTVLMSESQLAQLYLTAKRDQGINHLTKGGFTAYDAELLRNGKKVAAEQNAQQVSSVTYEDIIKVYDSLSDYAKKWIDAAEFMFNQQSSKAINDASMVLKHRKLATTKNYIPLAVNQYERPSEIESIKYDRTLEGAGTLKSVNKNAGQGLIIEGLHNVVDSHIDFVSQYAGLAIPIRNFNKVYGGVLSDNYSNTLHTYEVRGKKKEDDYSVLSVKSVRKALDSKWSTSDKHLATDIIDKTIRDLQSPRRSDRIKSMGKLQSAWVQATLSANISVTLKQAASYPTAAAVINGKYLDKAIRNKYAWSHFSDLCEEIDEHTGIHYKRRLGMSIQEIAEITKNQEALINKVPAIINPMKWIQAMDCRTTATLWIAAKYQIEAKYPDLQKGSNEYWQKITELYEECIEKTQPNYDVLHRAEIQKTPDSVKNIFAMFQTQPLQNTGLLYDSLFNLQAKARAYKADNTAENKAARDSAVKNLFNVCQSQMVAAAVFSAMTLFATALKGKMNRYRDDEDGDVTLFNVIIGFFNDMGSTILNTIFPLFGSTAYEFIEGAAGGIKNLKEGEDFKIDTYDLFSYPLVSTLNDTVKAFKGFFEDSVNLFNGKVSSQQYRDSLKDVIIQIGSLCGWPLGNIDKSLNGLKLWIEDMENGDFGEFEVAADRTTTQKLNAVIHEDGTDETKMYDKYADLIYSSSKGSDLLYYYLKEYGYDSSRYNKEEKAYCDAKIKFTTTENPDPLTSMKSKALSDYIDAKDNKRDDEEELHSLCLKLYGSESKLNKALETKQNSNDKKMQKALENYAYYKKNGPYDEYEKARQKCIQLYGDMTKVNEALEKLND